MLSIIASPDKSGKSRTAGKKYINLIKKTLIHPGGLL